MMSDDTMNTEVPAELTVREVLEQKLIDVMTPGAVIEFDPDEAEQAGAFVETALTEQEAFDSAMDLIAK